MAIVVVFILGWGLGLLLYLAQDWILNWDPQAYKNLQGKPFPDPIRLKQYPGYRWLLVGCWALPVGVGLIRWAIVLLKGT